jgi:hypothetical protein
MWRTWRPIGLLWYDMGWYAHLQFRHQLPNHHLALLERKTSASFSKSKNQSLEKEINQTLDCGPQRAHAVSSRT